MVASDAGSSRVSPNNDRSSQDPSPSVVKRLRGASKRMVTVYDYDPIALSPNVDAEVLDSLLFLFPL